MDWRNKPNQIFNKVKNQMFAKGIESFRFVDIFQSDFDPERTGKLTPHFFNLLTNKIGVFFSTQQIRNIKDIYSKDQGQTISYIEFLEDVKYSIPEKITCLISQAFDKLDPNNEGSACFEQMCKCYCVEQHPHVKSRRKSPEEVLDHFTTGMGRKVSDGRVSREGFVDYYAQLNFCISNERQTYFTELLKGVWQLVNAADYVSPARMRQIEHILFEKVRQKSDGKTNEWKTAKKAISYFDLGDEKSCDLPTFAKSLDKFGCNFKEHEIRALFIKYDADSSGRLDYEQFSKMLMDIDISGLSSKPNLLKTLGTNYFKITH